MKQVLGHLEITLAHAYWTNESNENNERETLKVMRKLASEMASSKDE